MIASFTLADPFEQKLRLLGDAFEHAETNSIPLKNLAGTVLPKVLSVVRKTMLPATVGIDTLRCLSSFMADGLKIGEHLERTGADILGEFAGSFAGRAAGAAVGEAIGSGIGTVLGGPLGCVPGTAIGEAVGSVLGSIEGSWAGAKGSEYLFRRLDSAA